tara:strand:- start:51980 stop:52693 length:714 start_codon:yes stop_codon:yes gene_type:complete
MKILNHVFSLKLMNKLLFLSILSTTIYAVEITEYEAKYRFESKEITISGVREFKKKNNTYEIEFNAANLFASMFFSSSFNINNDQVIAKNYDIKIRPKFLRRDQLINFNMDDSIIESKGDTSWVVNLSDSDLIFDPLNVQIMIRILIKKGFKEFDLNILDIKDGQHKNYKFRVLNDEQCIANKIKYNCLVLERYRDDSKRTVKYYLAKELDYMFLKIIDNSPERTNTLRLEQVLSFG